MNGKMASLDEPLFTLIVATLGLVAVGTCTCSVRESTKVTVAETVSKVTVVPGVKPIPRMVATADAGGVLIGVQGGTIDSASTGTGAAYTMPAGRTSRVNGP